MKLREMYFIQVYYKFRATLTPTASQSMKTKAENGNSAPQVLQKKSFGYARSIRLWGDLV